MSRNIDPKKADELQSTIIKLLPIFQKARLIDKLMKYPYENLVDAQSKLIKSPLSTTEFYYIENTLQQSINCFLDNDGNLQSQFKPLMDEINKLDAFSEKLISIAVPKEFTKNVERISKKISPAKEYINKMKEERMAQKALAQSWKMDMSTHNELLKQAQKTISPVLEANIDTLINSPVRVFPIERPEDRQNKILEEISSKLDKPQNKSIQTQDVDNDEVVFEIKYDPKDRRIILNNLYILAHPDWGTPNEVFFSYVYERANKEIEISSIEKELGEEMGEKLHQIIANLGFIGELKSLFFEASKRSGKVMFNNPILKKDLIAKKINTIKIKGRGK